MIPPESDVSTSDEQLHMLLTIQLRQNWVTSNVTSKQMPAQKAKHSGVDVCIITAMLPHDRLDYVHRARSVQYPTLNVSAHCGDL
jgi:hypothetical protein